MARVILGPPKRLEGNVAGESFLTTRTSPATPWIAVPRRASDPATIRGPFTSVTIHTYMHVRNRSTKSGATQVERSARTRSALLESAARGLSRYGYGNLVLEQVARDAGYTRGALYHQFKDKEDLALAVVEWVDETWRREVDEPVDREADPVAALSRLRVGTRSTAGETSLA